MAELTVGQIVDLAVQYENGDPQADSFEKKHEFWLMLGYQPSETLDAACERPFYRSYIGAIALSNTEQKSKLSVLKETAHVINDARIAPVGKKIIVGGLRNLHARAQNLATFSNYPYDIVAEIDDLTWACRREITKPPVVDRIGKMYQAILETAMPYVTAHSAAIYRAYRLHEN